MSVSGYKSVKGKYIKDETGQVISPITSIDTVFYDTGKDEPGVLKDYIGLGLPVPVYKGNTTSWKTSYSLSISSTNANNVVAFLVWYVIFNRDTTVVTSISDGTLFPCSSNSIPVYTCWGSSGNKFEVIDSFKFNSSFNTLTWESSRHVENAGFTAGTLIYRIFMIRNWNMVS